jgi:hypothetical protein
MWQLSKDFPFQEGELITGTRSKECAAPTVGKIQKNLLHPVHIRLGMMYFVKAVDHIWPG